MECVECGRPADASAEGWRGYLADDPRDADPAVTAIYCPECAEREFGGATNG